MTAASSCDCCFLVVIKSTTFPVEMSGFEAIHNYFFKPCRTLILIALLCFQVVDPKSEK